MKTKIFLIFLLFLFFLSCKKESPQNVPSYFRGKIDLYTDDSFKSVAMALADAYTISYPEAKINVVTKKEDFAFLDLLNNKAHFIIMSRDLSPKELDAYKKNVDKNFVPAKFAADAVVFVVSKDSQLNSIKFDEIKKELNSDDKKFIFDGANSSNLNFVAQKMNQQPSELKFSVIPGNENLIEQLHQYPDKIGVISLNTISREYSQEAQKLKSEIKILPVVFNNETYAPSIDNLRNMEYPFTRVLYFLTNEGGFNLANGIIRFSCTQLGQMVVQKEGLQPYNIYKREVQMR